MARDFREDREKYKCICGFLHIKTATWIIWGLNLAGLIHDLLLTRATLTGDDGEEADSITWFLGIISLMIKTFAWTMLLCGLVAERASFLVPYLIIKVLEFLLYGLIAVCLAIVLAFDANPKADDDSAQRELHRVAASLSGGTGWALAFLVGAFLLFTLIALWTVFKCRRYFLDLAAHWERTNSATNAYVYPAASTYRA
ncbi:unnamed protein product, partial [Mesorhabditis spiculigera]